MTHKTVNCLLIAMLLSMLVLLQATRTQIRHVQEERDLAVANAFKYQSECAGMEGQLARQQQINDHLENRLREHQQERPIKEETLETPAKDPFRPIALPATAEAGR